MRPRSSGGPRVLIRIGQVGRCCTSVGGKLQRRTRTNRTGGRRNRRSVLSHEHRADAIISFGAFDICLHQALAGELSVLDGRLNVINGRLFQLEFAIRGDEQRQCEQHSGGRYRGKCPYASRYAASTYGDHVQRRVTTCRHDDVSPQCGHTAATASLGHSESASSSWTGRPAGLLSGTPCVGFIGDTGLVGSHRFGLVGKNRALLHDPAHLVHKHVDIFQWIAVHSHDVGDIANR